MLPGYENLLFAHSSWYVYAATMRIFKHWDFKVQEPHTATGKLSFSSYPGVCIHSHLVTYMYINTPLCCRSLSMFVFLMWSRPAGVSG